MADAGAKDRAPEAALFASVLRTHAAPGQSPRRVVGLVLFVLMLHAAALLGVASLWHGVPRRMEGEATQGEVLVLRLTAPPASPPAGASTVSPPSPPRPRAARRTRPLRAPKPVREPTPSPRRGPSEPAASEPAASEPLSVAPPASIATGRQGSLASRAVDGVTQRSLGPGVAGLLIEAPPVPPPDTRAEEERRDFEQMFRDRFEDLPYPHQARMAGIEGQLVLRISVGVQGQLVGLSVVGHCPHPVLCEAAQDTVRRAAPFPPPPPALGGKLTIELPFNYHLE